MVLVIQGLVLRNNYVLLLDLCLKNISDDSDEEFQEKPPKYLQRRHRNH